MSTSSKSTNAASVSAKRASRVSSKRTTSAPKVAPNTTADTQEQAAVLRKRELINAVVRRSGVKKKAAKPVVEALLAELGECLSSGRELSLPPLGRIKINREKELPNGKVIVMKLRHKMPLPGDVSMETAAE